MSSPPPTDWQQWFESIWADREERLYPRFFGNAAPALHNLPQSTFASLGKPDPDPRFFTHAVLEYPPAGDRNHWLYVTSGMSNPWGDSPDTADPNGFSGLGYEFTLHAPAQARWPLFILHWLMAVQLLVATGDLQGELLQRHDRIPLGGSIAKKESVLTHLITTAPDALGNASAVSPHMPTYPPEFALASGRVELLLLVGISGREADFARTQGTEALLTLLHHREIFPLTDPDRLSTV